MPAQKLGGSKSDTDETAESGSAPHRSPEGFSDHFALAITHLLRYFADTFFAKRYGHRAVVLETVAAVPGMVGAMLTHLRCLRTLSSDEGWIRTLMAEAENERMHLMTFVEIARPTWLERMLILGAQWLFFLAFALLYLVSSRTAHRVVGYFEEEAVVSYTAYLQELDAGRSHNPPAPALAIHYWQLPPDARLREVLIAIRDDEAHHRDVNHAYASQLAGADIDTADIVAQCPRHAEELNPPKPPRPPLTT